MAKRTFPELWDSMTLENRRRLVGLLVADARVDEFKGSLSIRLRDLSAFAGQEVLP